MLITSKQDWVAHTTWLLRDCLHWLSTSLLYVNCLCLCCLSMSIFYMCMSLLYIDCLSQLSMSIVYVDYVVCLCWLSLLCVYVDCLYWLSMSIVCHLSMLIIYVNCLLSIVYVDEVQCTHTSLPGNDGSESTKPSLDNIWNVKHNNIIQINKSQWM